MEVCERTFLTSILKSIGYENIEVQKVECVGIKGGYFGSIFRLNITYNSKGNSNSVPCSFVCKFHPIVFRNVKLLIRETIFFKEFSDPTLFPFFPKLYFSKLDYESGEGFVLMEDLGKEFQLVNLKTGISLKQMKFLVDGVAKFHGFYWNKLKNLEKIFGKYKPPEINFSGVKKLLKELFEEYTSDEKKLSKFSEDVKKNLKFCGEKISEIMRRIYEIVKYRTLTHSDLWNNNVMFNKKNGCSFKIIDFQFCDIAIPYDDISFLIFSSMKIKDQVNHTGEILRYYFKRLILYGKEFKSIGKDEVLFDDFMKGYEISKIYGILFNIASEEVFEEFDASDRFLYTINEFFSDIHFSEYIKSVLE